jgi:hypothetical protein
LKQYFDIYIRQAGAILEALPWAEDGTLTGWHKLELPDKGAKFSLEGQKREIGDGTELSDGEVANFSGATLWVTSDEWDELREDFHNQKCDLVLYDHKAGMIVAVCYGMQMNISTILTSGESELITVSGTKTMSTAGADMYIFLEREETEGEILMGIEITGELEAFSANEGEASASQFYNVKGIRLAERIDITAPTGMELSTDEATWDNPISVAKDFDDKIHVRISEEAEGGEIDGNIAHASEGVTSRDVAVRGEVAGNPLAAPSVTTGATAVQGTLFTANWSSVADATGYLIDVATDETFTDLVGDYDDYTAGNVTSLVITGLLAGHNYYYRVRATDGARTSESSATADTCTLLASGEIESRMVTNSTPAEPNRAYAIFYFASKYKLGAADRKAIYGFRHYKNLNFTDTLYTEICHEAAANVSDSSIHTNFSASGGDSNPPLFYSSSPSTIGMMGGNHKWAYGNRLVLTLDADIAEYTDGAGSPITIKSAFLSDINSKLMALIGRTDVTITISSVDVPIFVFGVFPSLINETSSELAKVHLLIINYTDHDTCTEELWKYSKLTGTPTAIKMGETTISTIGTANISAYALEEKPVELKMHPQATSGDALDWFDPKHVLNIKPVGTTITDNFGNDLTDAIFNEEVNTTFSDGVEYIEVRQEYNIRNFYNFIEKIKADYTANGVYTFDEAAFNAAGRNSGYYGNPDYANLVDEPLTELIDIYRFWGWGLMEMERYMKPHVKNRIGALTAIMPAHVPINTSDGSSQTPKGYYYIPNTTDHDTIQEGGVLGNVENNYTGRMPDRLISLTADSAQTGQLKANRKVFYMAAGQNQLSGDSKIDDKWGDINTVFMTLPNGYKPYMYTMSRQDKYNELVDNDETYRQKSYLQVLPSGADSALSTKATAIYWALNDERDLALIYLDYHRDVTNDVVQLPPEFAGLPFVIHDSNNGVIVDVAGGGDGEREIGIAITTTADGFVNADGTVHITTSGTGDTVYAASPTNPTVYDLSSAAEPMPIGGIPTGNLAYMIIKVYKQSLAGGGTNITATLGGETLTPIIPAGSDSEYYVFSTATDNTEILGTFEADAGVDVEYLAVGGGGSGGAFKGAGGGAGGLVTGTLSLEAEEELSITVGKGGEYVTEESKARGISGSNTTIHSGATLKVSAPGGGGGATAEIGLIDGLPGGSGGGAAYKVSQGTPGEVVVGTPSENSFGNIGAPNYSVNTLPGAGGGAGEPGGTDLGYTYMGGDGMEVFPAIDPFETGSFYAGGGGGLSGGVNSAGAGGGGGGATDTVEAGNGVNGSGGGGGAGKNTAGKGDSGRGGNGCVIIKVKRR